MSEQNRELFGASIVAACVFGGAVLVCAVVGCEGRVESKPSVDFREMDNRTFCTQSLVYQIQGQVTALQKSVESLKQPTPAPIDYTPRFDAIDAQLKKLVERSVVVPPKCKGGRK